MSDPDQHVCEVQLVHAAMVTVRKHCNAHTAYAKFRSALELLETFGLAPGAMGQTISQCEGLFTVEVTAHREFVRQQEDDYKDFLLRYQRSMGFVSPPANGNSNDADAKITKWNEANSMHADMSSVKELRSEVARLHEEHHRQVERSIIVQRQVEQLRLQLEKLSK